MASANFLLSYGTNAPLEGRMDFNQGLFLVGGRATFTSTDATCTTPPRMGKTLIWALAAGGDSGSASTVGTLSYSVAADGTITWRRTTTTANGEFSFLAAYCG